MSSPESQVRLDTEDEDVARLAIDGPRSLVRVENAERQIVAVGAPGHGYRVAVPMAADQEPWGLSVLDSVIEPAAGTDPSVTDASNSLAMWMEWIEPYPLDWLLAALPRGRYFAIRSRLQPRRPDTILLGNCFAPLPSTMAFLHESEGLFAAAISPRAAAPDFDPPVLVGITILNYIGCGVRTDGVWFADFAPPSARCERLPDEPRLFILPVDSELVIDEAMRREPSMYRDWEGGDAERAARVLTGQPQKLRRLARFDPDRRR